MNEVAEVSLELCYPSDDARAVDGGAVKALAASIEEVGLLNPISVRRAVRVRAGRDADAFEVLAGMHRVKAFRQLGRETIPAYVFDADDLHASLILIDENLCRKDLSPAERAGQIAKRKRIYEALYPETVHGATGRGRPKSPQVEDSNEIREVERFTKATSVATGKSEQTVQREAARGEALGEEALARVARTSLDKGEELDALAKLPEEKREELIVRAEAGEKVSAKVEVKKDRRGAREVELGDKQRALPDKKYGVILADPEWRFEPYSRETGMDRAADNHYPTSETDVIASRPVASIAADDCVLFLWATAPMLPQALKVMEAWGFAYKTHMIWNKDRIGTGYWFRNKHELLLVGTRGEIPAPAMGTQAGSVLDAPVGAHSEKPEDSYRIIELYYPTLPKIELNARRRREGWEAWGLEAPEIDPNTHEIIETKGNDHAEREHQEERAAGDEGNSGGSDREDQRRLHVAAGERDQQEGDHHSSASGNGIQPQPDRHDPVGAAATEGLVLPVDREAKLAALRATIKAPAASVVDVDLNIPDDLLRVELSKKELAMLNRLSLEDADRDEQEFITRARKHPESATVATRNRIAEIAKAQGLTTEQAL